MCFSICSNTVTNHCFLLDGAFSKLQNSIQNKANTIEYADLIAMDSQNVKHDLKLGLCIFGPKSNVLNRAILFVALVGHQTDRSRH